MRPVRQSGVIPYRLGAAGLEIALITALRRPRWIIPKGMLEPGMSPRESACKESFEEAGLLGPAHPQPVGEYQYAKLGATYAVEVFAQAVETVLDRWPEDGQRQRRWLPLAAAIAAVEEPDLQQLIARLPAFLATKE